MEYAENLVHLSGQLLRYKKEEKEILETEHQRQLDGVMMYGEGVKMHRDSLICITDVLYDRYMRDLSYVRRRITILKYYISRLVSSGHLEKRDWEHILSL